MKSSMFIAAASAMLVSAGPLGKRAMETHWVTDIVTVTVTDGPPKATAAPAVFVEKPAPPPPAPTTTSIKKVVVTQAPPKPAPKPTPKVEPPPPPPKQSAPPPETPSGGDGSYQGTIIDSHTAHRANHSAGPLEWDSTLAQYAETIAKGCVFAHDMNQGGGGYGQNLASWGTSGNLGDSTAAGAKAAADWYNEVANFNYFGDANPPSSAFEGIGHFTQMVWKSSQKVGCATVECPAGTIFSMASYYTVCNYSPPGNFGGEYASNVLPALGMKALTVDVNL